MVLEGDPPTRGQARTLGVAPAGGANSEVLGPDDVVIDEFVPFADDGAFRSVEFRLAGSESSGLRRWFIWPLLVLP